MKNQAFNLRPKRMAIAVSRAAYGPGRFMTVNELVQEATIEQIVTLSQFITAKDLDWNSSLLKNPANLANDLKDLQAAINGTTDQQEAVKTIPVGGVDVRFEPIEIRQNGVSVSHSIDESTRLKAEWLEAEFKNALAGLSCESATLKTELVWPSKLSNLSMPSNRSE